MGRSRRRALAVINSRQMLMQQLKLQLHTPVAAAVGAAPQLREEYVAAVCCCFVCRMDMSEPINFCTGISCQADPTNKQAMFCELHHVSGVAGLG